MQWAAETPEQTEKNHEYMRRRRASADSDERIESNPKEKSKSSKL